MLWLTLPFTLGEAVSGAVDGRSDAVRLTVVVLAWLGWGLALGVSLVAAPRALTATRVLAVAAPVGGAVAVAVAAVEGGYMKEALVSSNRARVEAIERGAMKVVGVNAYTESEASPLVGGEEDGLKSIQKIEAHVEGEQIARLNAWRAKRHGWEAAQALAQLEAAAKEDRNIMPASIACAKAG
ncbi:MAG: methylmalonyl-CoA mutase family protein, partial [Microthrixaceae bacterium]